VGERVTASAPGVSVVIPVRNEEGNLAALSQRLVAVLTAMNVSFEIVFVTDLNTDGTVDALRRLHAAEPRVKAVKLSNAFGHHMAVVAGLDAARGAAVVVMDGDLQDLPEDIPKLHARLLEGFDLVYAVKQRKNESAWRNFLSRTFVRVLNRLSDRPVEFNTSMFRIMSRRAADALRMFRETDQSLTGLAALVGLPTSRVLVTSGVRGAGTTNFGLRRQVNFAISFLLAFSTRPLRMISFAGFTISALSFAYLVYVLLRWASGSVPVQGWASVAGLVSLLGGMQLLALGVIGEYVARTFIESKRRPLYIVEETMGDVAQPRAG